ncbi:MAG: DUF4834 family protein [Muribaculaceae bacterium]|nr:DUF4834 family protein [Muribaculaceae bacterium]
MYLLLFLILIFYWFIIRPYLKVRKVMKNAQRQANEFFGGSGSPFGTGSSGHSPRPHRRRHKKIDPDVGEYIEFEELTTATTYSYTETHYEIEDQIEDADWEDIK